MDSTARGARPSAELAILGLLLTSFLLLALAPLVLDDSYSWLEHTTSQAGAQRVRGAWMARSGFLLLGLAVLWLAHRRAGRWRQPSTALHAVFGACLAGVAAFSLRSWDDTVPFDRTEDLLHSVAATAMGFAFAFGIASARWTWGRRPQLRTFDVLAIGASVVLPLAMVALGEYAGAFQRAMFAIAYVWYATEVVQAWEL
jgi:hypothetical membrane protein